MNEWPSQSLHPYTLFSVRVWVCLVSVCGHKKKVTADAFPGHSPLLGLFVYYYVFHSTWSTSLWLDWLANDLQGFSCSPPPQQRGFRDIGTHHLGSFKIGSGHSHTHSWTWQMSHWLCYLHRTPSWLVHIQFPLNPSRQLSPRMQKWWSVLLCRVRLCGCRKHLTLSSSIVDLSQWHQLLAGWPRPSCFHVLYRQVFLWQWTDNGLRPIP